MGSLESVSSDSVELEKGLRAYYRFDDAENSAGYYFSDKAGGGFEAEFGDSSRGLIDFDTSGYWRPGRVGDYSLRFNESRDTEVTFGLSSESRDSLNSGSFAVSYWLKPESTTARRWANYMMFSGSSSRVEIMDPSVDWGGIETLAVFWEKSDGSEVRVNSTSDATELDPGEWNNVLFQYDGQEFELWINGELAESNSVSTSLEPVDSPLVASGDNITWGLDNLAIYNRSFSGKEVRALSNLTDNFRKTDEWRFEAGSGSKVYNSANLDRKGVLDADSVVLDNNTNISVNGSVLDTGQNFTISFWLKSEYNEVNVLSGLDSGVFVDIDDGLSCGTYSGADIDSVGGTRFFENKWNHVSLVRDDSEFTCTVNGERLGSMQSADISSEAFVFGGNISGSRSFNIDELRLYNRSLTASNVESLGFR
ncbi:LamG domain-containing protein [Candidatus Nanohalovita haloferacivicina]|uniref:LamG domain-containing protein n=1 Tax=Candidatus Nanohalovita haloferacivicina TaxID=2978046 RepID=UPI00325FA991